MYTADTHIERGRERDIERYGHMGQIDKKCQFS